MCVCLSTKHHFFYKYVINADSKYDKRLLLLFFLFLLPKKYADLLQIVYMTSWLKTIGVQKMASIVRFTEVKQSDRDERLTWKILLINK